MEIGRVPSSEKPITWITQPTSIIYMGGTFNLPASVGATISPTDHRAVNGTTLMPASRSESPYTNPKTCGI